MSENKPTKKKTSKTEEVTKVEEPIVETTKVQDEKEQEAKVEKPKAERKQSKPEPIKQKHTIPATVKEMFLKSIAKIPYSIYQNGKLIVTYTPTTKIVTEDDGFTVHNKKFGYTGIEIKHA